MLVMGFCTRTMAVVLLPVAVATVLFHSGAGIGISISEIAYLAGCLAGMALLAGGIQSAGDGEQPKQTAHVDWLEVPAAK